MKKEITFDFRSGVLTEIVRVSEAAAGLGEAAAGAGLAGAGATGALGTTLTLGVTVRVAPTEDLLMVTDPEAS